MRLLPLFFHPLSDPTAFPAVPERFECVHRDGDASSDQQPVEPPRVAPIRIIDEEQHDHDADLRDEMGIE